MSGHARVSKKTLGKYLVGRPLGWGMPEAHAARRADDPSGRLVALQVLSQSMAEREVAAALERQHPNVARVLDVTEIDGTPFAATELVFGSSLAVCSANVGGPLPLAIAIRVFADAARGMHAAHRVSLAHEVSSEGILIGHDGTVKLSCLGLGPIGPGRTKAIDLRFFVSLIGELTHDLPAPIADFLALPDNHPSRASADAFASAFVAAATSAGVTPVTNGDLARWARAVDPPRMTEADVAASFAPPPMASVASAPMQSAAAVIPDLDFAPVTPRSIPQMAAVRPPASAPGAAPASARTAPALPPQIPDDDEFGMEIERNVTSAALPTAQSHRGAATSSSMSLATAAPISQRGIPIAATASGLEVAHVRTRARADSEEFPSVGRKIAGIAAGGAPMAAAAAAFFHFLHRRGGFPITQLMPHAFDGTSAAASGGVSMGAVVVAVTLGFAGFKMVPRSWLIVAAGAPTLIAALAMVTVTLSSTGENTTPPDGALLLPYVLPVSFALTALGLAVHAGHLFAGYRTVHKILALPLAIVAGAALFAGFEISPFAH